MRPSPLLKLGKFDCSDLALVNSRDWPRKLRSKEQLVCSRLRSTSGRDWPPRRKGREQFDCCSRREQLICCRLALANSRDWHLRLWIEEQLVYSKAGEGSKRPELLRQMETEIIGSSRTVIITEFGEWLIASIHSFTSLLCIPKLTSFTLE